MGSGFSLEKAITRERRLGSMAKNLMVPIFGSVIRFGHHRRAATIGALRPFIRTGALSVLDIGCGGGEFGDLLSFELPDSRIVAIDAELKAMRAASEVPSLRGLTVQGNGSTLPFKDAAFDLVTVLEVIEHLEDPDAFLREVRRVMKDDALLLITTPNRRSITAMTGRTVHTILRIPPWSAWDPGHRYISAPDEVAGQLQSTGFSLLKLSGYWLLPEGIQLLPEALGELRMMRSFVETASSRTFWVDFGFISILIAQKREPKL